MIKILSFLVGIITLALSMLALFLVKADFSIWGVLLLLGILFISVALYMTFRKKTATTKSKTIVSFDGTSVYGLPQGEAKCKVKLYNDCVTFTTGKQTANLNLEKISSAFLKTKKELEGAKTGSIIAGAMFFGAVGAIVGSRTRTNENYILIINYSDNGEAKAIAVAMDKLQRFEGEKAEKFINKKANKYQNETEIQL